MDPMEHSLGVAQRLSYRQANGVNHTRVIVCTVCRASKACVFRQNHGDIMVTVRLQSHGDGDGTVKER